MKKMKKVYKIIIWFVLLFILIGGIFYFFVLKKDNDKVDYLDTIEGYNYKLEANATELMKQEFALLKEILSADEIDEEAFAQQIAKLFVIDLYTMSNKLNNSDVGSKQYVLPKIVDNFILNVQNTLYKYLEDNSNDKRTQELPEVSGIEIISTETIEFEHNEKKLEAYKIKVSWTYIKDMEYDTEAEVILIMENAHFYVIEFNFNREE